MTPSDDDYQPFGVDDAQSTSDAPDSPWDWGIVKTPDGDIIEPGACDGYHNKRDQRDLLDGGGGDA